MITNRDKLMEIKDKWTIEQGVYENIESDTKLLLKKELMKEASYFTIDSRVKKFVSLMKKVIIKAKRKNVSYNDAYGNMTDKLGIRITVRFKSEQDKIDGVLSRVFDGKIKYRDEKLKDKDNEFGYQAIHYDIKETRDGKSYLFELQLRTICQSSWSDLSHEIFYKNISDIGFQTKRSVNALSAVFEVADNEFDRIFNQNQQNSKLDVNGFSRKLEWLYNLVSDEISYYSEATTEIIENIISPMYGEDFDSLYKDIVTTIDENFSFISSIIKENSDDLMINQPEFLAIYHLLLNKKIRLKTRWSSYYDLSILEQLANKCGQSVF